MKDITDVILRGFAALGMFATAMFVMGYLYASIPLVRERACTPSNIDRILK